MKNKNVFSYFNKMTKEEWDSKSPEWKKGWRAGQLGEDIIMSDEEIESMSDDWKDGLVFAITHPTGGYVPM